MSAALLVSPVAAVWHHACHRVPASHKPHHPPDHEARQSSSLRGLPRFCRLPCPVPGDSSSALFRPPIPVRMAAPDSHLHSLEKQAPAQRPGRGLRGVLPEAAAEDGGGGLGCGEPANRIHRERRGSLCHRILLVHLRFPVPGPPPPEIKIVPHPPFHGLRSDPLDNHLFGCGGR